MRLTAPCSLALLSWVVSACASTTSGREWVHEPEDANLDTDAAYAARELEPMPAAVAKQPGTTQPAEVASADAPRTRLSHTISLGQSEAPSSVVPLATAYGAAPVSGSNVVVINNYGSNPYVGGYGYPLSYRTAGAGSAGFAPATPSVWRGASPALGGDWARPPSYGPTFPYHTAPASPWGRQR